VLTGETGPTHPSSISGLDWFAEPPDQLLVARHLLRWQGVAEAGQLHQPPAVNGIRRQPAPQGPRIDPPQDPGLDLAWQAGAPLPQQQRVLPLDVEVVEQFSPANPLGDQRLV
jgi:hypothetical protein